MEIWCIMHESLEIGECVFMCISIAIESRPPEKEKKKKIHIRLYTNAPCLTPGTAT